MHAASSAGTYHHRLRLPQSGRWRDRGSRADWRRRLDRRASDHSQGGDNRIRFRDRRRCRGRERRAPRLADRRQSRQADPRRDCVAVSLSQPVEQGEISAAQPRSTHQTAPRFRQVPKRCPLRGGDPHAARRAVRPLPITMLGHARIFDRAPQPEAPVFMGLFDAPERIRTSDLRFRRPTLYPAELRAHSG